ncbi:MAG: hypothetical protein ACFFCS_02415 [Candidatus Hodarchaeota archaeon]
MQHLWIINKGQGTPLFYRSYSDINIDPDLISGLLSAFNNFSEVELKGTGIESINMSGLQWVYLNQPDIDMLLIAADNKSGSAEVMRSRLEVIMKMFVDQFDIKPENVQEKIIKVTQYKEFAPVLDMLREQWDQADLVMNAAELFDILGVFQQLFNIFFSIVQKIEKPDYYEVIQDIKEYSVKMERLFDIEQFPEFKKLEFDEEAGWSVINLDPTKINKYQLKKALFLITSHLKIVLSKNLGYTKMLNAVSKELLPYIFSSWELLEVLNVVKPLLTILLERPSIQIEYRRRI